MNLNRKRFGLLLAGLAMAACIPAVAADARDGAVAMVRNAAAYLKSNGAEKTFNEVTNGKTFKDGELYVFIYDMNGKCVAHGANPRLVGKDLIGLKDPDGKLIVRSLLDMVNEKGKGWTEPFKFRNPATDKMQLRRTYAEKLGDYVIGSGVYVSDSTQ